MRAQLIGRAYSAFAASNRRHALARLLESFPDVGAARRVDAEAIVMTERVGEKAESILSAPPGFVRVLMNGKTGNHRDVGVHRVTDGNAFLLEDAVIVVD